MLRQHGPLYRIVVPVAGARSLAQLLHEEPWRAQLLLRVWGSGLLEMVRQLPWYVRAEPIPASQWYAVARWCPAAGGGSVMHPKPGGQRFSLDRARCGV